MGLEAALVHAYIHLFVTPTDLLELAARAADHWRKVQAGGAIAGTDLSFAVTRVDQIRVHFVIASERMPPSTNPRDS